MKKTLSVILAIAFAVSIGAVFGACAPREEILKVYNWGDYIDEDIFDDFKEYYADATGGKKITVKYDTYDNNETKFNKYKSNRKPDYDLICPSEYMIQEMLALDMLSPLTRNGDGGYTYVTNFDNVVADLRDETLEYEGKKINDYAVPYMWGTLGLLYNVDYVTQEEVETWGTLLVPSGTHADKKITMKDSVRDAFFAASLYYYRDELTGLYGDSAAHKAKVQEIADRTDAATVNGVKNILSAQSGKLYSYESDEGKGDMVTGNLHLGLMWSGDAVWAFDEEFALNPAKINLAYYIPREGGNIWSDSFVVPKYAKNSAAAEIFLNFLCETEIAKRNMQASGYTCAVQDAIDEYKAELEEDEMWDSPMIANTGRGDRAGKPFAEWYKAMYLDTLFPSEETLARCGVMKFFGADNDAINDMWDNVR
ncbi:MAG: ABC transporter substrate-binding protein [Clostridiales bacterium]|nr:ABC transporter substrate-binding protein [Clostridiales bacterium]